MPLIVVPRIAKKIPQMPTFLLNPFPTIPASPPSEPMECESVAAVDLTREIEEVIESPVREDMMARDNAAEGSGTNNTRNVEMLAQSIHC